MIYAVKPGAKFWMLQYPDGFLDVTERYRTRAQARKQASHVLRPKMKVVSVTLNIVSKL